jgi:hypothetical protein
MRALLLLIPVLVLAGVACERKTAQTPSRPSVAVLPDTLFVNTEPPGAQPVEEVKKTAKVGDTVTISGRIGGSREPFVAERAVFTIVGPGIPACSDVEGDACESPWDYCCESKEDIAAHAATIQVVGSNGMPIPESLRDAHGIKELSTVVVVGTVVMADGPNLVINATQIYTP